MNGKTVVGIVVGVLCYFGVRNGLEYHMSDRVAVPKEIREHPAFEELAKGVEGVEKELDSAGSMEEALRISASGIKPKLPIRIDENSTLVDVAAGPGRNFLYVYHLNDIGNTTAVELEESMRPGLEQSYNSSGMKPFKDGKVVVKYRYLDEEEQLITEIVIGP